MIEIFKKIALSFPNVVEKPHFEKTSFRVQEKIFATLDEDTKIVTIKLSKSDQSEFCSINPIFIYPAPGKWGERGWTFAELSKIPEELITEMLNTAYNDLKKQK